MLYPACLSASLPGGSSLLVPACCFMWCCVTDLMTCDPTVHLATPEFTWLFPFFFFAVTEFPLPLSASDLQTTLLRLLNG